MSVDVDLDLVLAAADEQRPFVVARLRTWAMASNIDEVMGVLRSDVWFSLDRWETAGRPPLGAWANGVARHTVHEWIRTERPGRGPGGAVAVTLDALSETRACLLNGADQATNVEAERAGAVIRALEAQVTAEPGGAARWAQMVRDATHARRGVNVRAELQKRISTLQVR